MIEQGKVSLYILGWVAVITNGQIKTPYLSSKTNWKQQFTGPHCELWDV